jgi:hypothetical protein
VAGKRPFSRTRLPRTKSLNVLFFPFSVTVSSEDRRRGGRDPARPPGAVNPRPAQHPGRDRPRRERGSAPCATPGRTPSASTPLHHFCAVSDSHQPHGEKGQQRVKAGEPEHNEAESVFAIDINGFASNTQSKFRTKRGMLWHAIIGGICR